MSMAFTTMDVVDSRILRGMGVAEFTLLVVQEARLVAATPVRSTVKVSRIYNSYVPYQLTRPTSSRRILNWQS